jgi:carbonic anhydrase
MSSCPDSNAPIDINMNDIVGECDLKCSYSFKYSSSSCVVTNMGDYIKIAYDNPSSPPVKYNGVEYYVSEVRIYTLSLHSYRGYKTDGEMIIVHNSASGSKPLLVCVPMQESESTSSASTMITEIITTMGTNAPTNGETTNVDLDDFNLDAFVPKKTYFYYTGKEPYQPCASDVEYIVYIPQSGPINITSTALSLLQTVITKNLYVIGSGSKLFYNKNGSESGTSTGLNDIYIDCQPVGVSDDETTVITGAPLNQNDIFNMLISFIKSPYFVVLVIFLLIYLMSTFSGTGDGVK